MRIGLVSALGAQEREPLLADVARPLGKVRYCSGGREHCSQVGRRGSGGKPCMYRDWHKRRDRQSMFERLGVSQAEKVGNAGRGKDTFLSLISSS